MKETLALFGQHLLDPSICYLIPTTQAAAQRVEDKVHEDHPQTIVEWGPGTGPLTRKMLDGMPKDGKLIVIELNKVLHDRLKDTVQDPRLTIVHGSALDTRGILNDHGVREGDVDHVVSSIPYSKLKTDMKMRLATETHALLQPHGSYVVLNVRYDAWREMRKVFGNATDERIWENWLPPLVLFQSFKNGRRNVASSNGHMDRSPWETIRNKAGETLHDLRAAMPFVHFHETPPYAI